MERVEESDALVQLLDLGGFLLGDLEVEDGDVLRQSGLLRGLGDNDDSPREMPGENYLSRALAVLLREFFDDGLVEEVQGLHCVGSQAETGSADGGVGSHRDAELLVEVYEGFSHEVRVHFYLVVGWLDLAAGDDVHEHDHGAVGDTDRSDVARFDEGFHVFPGLLYGNRFNLSVGNRDWHVHVVHKIQIQVLSLKLGEGPLDSGLDVFSLVNPQFGGDKEVFSLDITLSVDFDQSVSNSFLVAVKGGSVDVSVAVLEYSLLHNSFDLFRRSQEGSQADLGHVFSGVQLDLGYLISFYHLI